jgi:outer membrane lipoprotein-sorting protein
MKNSIIAAFILSSSVVFGQSATDILGKLTAKFNAVKDYTVNAHISADIPMINIMPSNVKIYFKQKDKFKIESKGIVIVPKQGFTELNDFIANQSKYTPVFGEDMLIRNVATRLINIIPNEGSGDIILAKIWVDPINMVIMRSQITTQSNGTVKVDYTYGDQLSKGLPSIMKFEIDVKKFKIPKSVAADINKTASDKKKAKDRQRKTGSVTITLSNYKVNTGLADSLFEKKKKS